ncbi:hypothetical protein ONZ45_g14366 [Pleurotus djamor]|nr:hypothetical protein ONZ45_g14366 [Pleurotus djamor]
MRTTNLEAADKAAKKKMPRLKLGVNDLMKSVKVKLEQTLYRLEILQELKYEPTLYAPFQEQWDIHSAEYEALKQSKPAAWNVVKSISYLSDVCALKAGVKALYERCVTASEQKRQKNLKTMNYQRCQKDVKASLSSVPGPDWIPILEKFLDSDDELSDDSNEDNEDNDEGNEDDEGQGERTPRCAAFGAGISR